MNTIIPKFNTQVQRQSDYRANGNSLLLQRASTMNSMNKTLRQLIQGLNVKIVQGKIHYRIQSIVTDSRRVVPGSLFLALPGMTTKGSLYIEEAIERGAVAVMSEESSWVPPKTTLIQVDDVRGALAKISARFYGNAESRLDLTAVLGTSGKTVVSFLYRYLIEQEKSVGLLGTINYQLGKRTLPAYRTTPEPVDLHAMLSQMKRNDCQQAVLEVSSHGIHQRRVEGVPFKEAVFLNLGEEHLDYHGSRENYLKVFQSFFSDNAKSLRLVALSKDDAASGGLLSSIPKKAKVISFGFHNDADVRAENVEYFSNDTRFDLVWPEGKIRVVSPMIGMFNVQNVLAAFALAYGNGNDLNLLAAKLFDFSSVPGRMENIDMGQDFSVVVDYMHTETSYRKGLEMLRELTSGRIITVFGCGGNRDPEVRPKVLAEVQGKSDFAIATSDNPRGETLQAIFTDMKRGLDANKSNIIFVEDRKQAIATAIKLAKPGDTVLIAGKGHEGFQEYSDCVVPFDDRATAKEIIRELSQ